MTSKGPDRTQKVVCYLETISEAMPKAAQSPDYSHSMVPGGLEVTS